MTRSKFSFSSAHALILGTLLAFPLTAAAQRHGGAGMGNSSLSGNSRPSGVKEEDSLRDFHEAMAVQATSQQTVEFQALVKSTDAAKAELQKFLENQPKENSDSESADRKSIDRTTLDQTLEDARNGNKKFEQGFSPAQKSGLKEIAKRLAKADSDLEQEEKKLDASIDAKAGAADITAHAESLKKTLTDFSNQQLALGREMSITLATGQDLAFTLPTASHPVNIANQTIGVPVSGSLSQTAVQGGQRTFKLELMADLSDVQQNITDLLRAQLNTLESCGERIAIQQATLMPSTPAGLLIVKLHFERWTCGRVLGQSSSTELAEEDGSVEIKLTAAIEKPNALKITAAFGRIDATGMMGEELRSGSLGENLRDAVAQSIQTAAQTGSDFKITLPPAVQNSATIQTARFQDTGVGGLSVVVDGQVEISNDQADALASQLNQALSAQGTPPK